MSKTISEGGKSPQHILKKRVNRAVLGRFGYVRPPARVRHASLDIFHRSNPKSIGWEPTLGQNSFFVVPNRSCRKRHWFPADGIGCLPFWSGLFFQHSYIYITYLRGRRRFSSYQLSISFNIGLTYHFLLKIRCRNISK